MNDVFLSISGSANAALSNVDVQALLKKLVVSFQRFCMEHVFKPFFTRRICLRKHPIKFTVIALALNRQLFAQKVAK